MPFGDGPDAEERARIAEGLKGEAHALTEEVGALRVQVEEERTGRERERRRRRLATVVAGVAVVLLALSTTISSLGYIRLGNSIEQNRRNGDFLVNCTTPTPAPTKKVPHPKRHTCWESSAENSAKAIGSIDQFIVYAAECARQFGTDPEIERCVGEKAKASNPGG